MRSPTVFVVVLVVVVLVLVVAEVVGAGKAVVGCVDRVRCLEWCAEGSGDGFLFFTDNKGACERWGAGGGGVLRRYLAHPRDEGAGGSDNDDRADGEGGNAVGVARGDAAALVADGDDDDPLDHGAERAEKVATDVQQRGAHVGVDATCQLVHLDRILRVQSAVVLYGRALLQRVRRFLQEMGARGGDSAVAGSEMEGPCSGTETVRVMRAAAASARRFFTGAYGILLFTLASKSSAAEVPKKW